MSAPRFYLLRALILRRLRCSRLCLFFFHFHRIFAVDFFHGLDCSQTGTRHFHTISGTASHSSKQSTVSGQGGRPCAPSQPLRGRFGVAVGLAPRFHIRKEPLARFPAKPAVLGSDIAGQTSSITMTPWTKGDKGANGAVEMLLSLPGL